MKSAAIVSVVFPPEPVVSARTSFDVARGLVERGYDVTVVAPFPNRPAGRVYAGHRRRLLRRERSDEGFTIVRCFSFLSRKSSIPSRLAENISFGITSSMALLRMPRPDVLYMNSWPIFASALTTLAARFRRIPVIVSVQDVYPESLLSQERGGVTRWLSRLILAIDRFVVRKAAAVILISRKFADHYSRTRGLAESAMRVIPNWLTPAGTDEIAGEAASARTRNGIPADAFLLVYGGNVGVAASVETIVESLRELPPNVHLLVAGEGASLDRCRRLAADIAPDRVHFQPHWPAGTTDVLHAADVLVLPTNAAQSAASVPSKLISYLLAARPVIAMALPDSETAATMSASRAGIVVPPGDPKRVAEAVNEMMRMPSDTRHEIGVAARQWALANVTTDVCLPPLLDLIEAKR
jgi:putative colanic acid biosynthesis glycosyltransferase WcaI